MSGPEPLLETEVARRAGAPGGPPEAPRRRRQNRRRRQIAPAAILSRTSGRQTRPHRRRETPPVGFKEIIYTVEDGGVGVITLNRPNYRNAQSYRMLDEIDQAFDLARPDEDVRVVLVRGAGGVFSTGHDLGTPEG